MVCTDKLKREQVSELIVLLGGGGEHLRVPFYTPRKRVVPLACLLAFNGIVVARYLGSGATRQLS
jgi:hypothetical protein